MTNTDKKIDAAAFVGGKTLDDLRREQQRAEERQYDGSPYNEAVVEYLKKVFEAEQSGPVPINPAVLFDMEKRPQKAHAQVMAYNQARRSVWYIAKGKAAAQGRTLCIDEDNRDLYRNLTKYFICDPSSDYDLTKGLFLFGPTGTGKTFLIEIFKRLCDVHRIEYRQFRQAVCSAIYESAQAAQSTSGLSLYHTGNYFFDDLGDEPANLKLYGNDINVMGSILTQRAQRFSVGHCLTYITSNIGEAELEQRYGTRIASRASQMFNFVFVDGPDRRK